MEKGLMGKRVVICGSRKLDEISLLIKKQGGIPIIRTLQGTVFLAEKEVISGVEEFVNGGTDWVVLTTGVGTEALVNLSEKKGLKELFLKRLADAKIAARGYKTLAALKKLGIQPAAVDGDGTIKSLRQELDQFDFTEKKVMIQLHGEDSPELTAFFKNKGAVVQTILPYQIIAPNPQIVEQLCNEILQRECDAVCFTTATQVRALFDYAREKAIVPEIIQCFSNPVTAVAVGKVTAEALNAECIERVVVPEIERMGAMIVELSRYYKELTLN